MELSIFHISEMYLYEYYNKDNDYTISSEDKLTPLLEEGIKLENAGQDDAALQKYLSAHMENPVNYEAYSSIIRVCRKKGDLQGLYNYTIESYNYCCTRAELALFYRNLGFYYLEKYKPEVASALYQYSKLFKYNENADSEINYLKEAMGDKIHELTIEEMQSLLKKEEIPLAANSITLALLVKAAEEAEETKLYNQALDCYKMVYDLTGDNEIETRINILNEKI